MSTPQGASPTPATEGVQVGPLLGCIIAASVGGALLGGITNAVTASFAAEYFRAVLRWWDIEDLWRASVAEGVFQGLLFGFFGALFFALFLGITTRCRVGYHAVARGLILTGFSALLGWALGGAIGIGIVLLSPERFERLFRVPEDQELAFDAVAFGWAGGSTSGILLGALAGVIVAFVRIRAHHRLALESERVAGG
jgi:hypothetical protein